MKHTLKRLFSAFLVSCLLLTMFPLSVFASSTNGSSIIEVLFIVMMVETLGHTVTAFLEQSVMNLLL